MAFSGKIGVFGDFLFFWCFNAKFSGKIDVFLAFSGKIDDFSAFRRNFLSKSTFLRRFPAKSAKFSGKISVLMAMYNY